MSLSMTTFLYIEDDLELRQLIAKAIRDRGVSVLTASTGREAFEILKSREIDLVISDLEMPEFDGIELRNKAVNELKILPKVWIGFSGAAKIDLEYLKKIGFDEILFKPLSITMLLQICHNFLVKKSDAPS